MKRRKSWDVKPEPLFRVPIDAPVDGHIDGVPTRGVPTVAVGDLVKYIIPDDWEHFHRRAITWSREESKLGNANNQPRSVLSNGSRGLLERNR